MIDYFEQRTEFSQEKIAIVTERVNNIAELKDKSEIGIYVTGSYGRLEATLRSDLDLFIIHRDTHDGTALPPGTAMIIKGEIIKIGRDLGFPEFSGEGEYLKVHSLKDMLLTLGGRQDDSSNNFTARLLLLLESRPIFNEAAYRGAVSEVIEAYFRDYHDHEIDFRPIFLVNDILRFWKTLCLNYENRRNIPTGDQEKKTKVYLKNLKLKYSLLLTCFSTVIPMSAAPHITPAGIESLVSMPPLKRLEKFAGEDRRRQDVYSKIVEEYVWFREQVSRVDAQQWIAERQNRSDAFERARAFGSYVYSLLQLATESTDKLRYLVI